MKASEHSRASTKSFLLPIPLLLSWKDGRRENYEKVLSLGLEE